MKQPAAQGGISAVYEDPGFHGAVESLLKDRPCSIIAVEVVAGFLRREETSLFKLKKAGLSPDVIEACFLLGHCGDSLIPERLEGVRANPLARSGKIRELQARLEQGRLMEKRELKWDVVRDSLERALDFLENGSREDLSAGRRGLREPMERSLVEYEEESVF